MIEAGYDWGYLPAISVLAGYLRLALKIYALKVDNYGLVFEVWINPTVIPAAKEYPPRNSAQKVVLCDHGDGMTSIRRFVFHMCLKRVIPGCPRAQDSQSFATSEAASCAWATKILRRRLVDG